MPEESMVNSSEKTSQFANAAESGAEVCCHRAEIKNPSPAVQMAERANT